MLSSYILTVCAHINGCMCLSVFLGVLDTDTDIRIKDKHGNKHVSCDRHSKNVNVENLRIYEKSLFRAKNTEGFSVTTVYATMGCSALQR